MSDAENSPAQTEPVAKKKILWKAWFPVAFFALAAVFVLVLYVTERALRSEAEEALAGLRTELIAAQTELAELEKMGADAEKEFSRQLEELSQKIETLESDKIALEKERDQYKEGSWNSQQELEKLKAEIVALRTQAQPAPAASLSEGTPVPQA